jgi:hypothetical protein
LDDVQKFEAVMTIREKLHAEIDNLDDQSVDVVYKLVRDYASSKAEPKKGDLLTLLRQIRIDGPPDFSENLDLYLYGGKSFPEDVH